LPFTTLTDETLALLVDVKVDDGRPANMFTEGRWVWQEMVRPQALFTKWYRLSGSRLLR